MSEGLAHCLTLNLAPMKDILKHVFNINESNMQKPLAIELLTEALTDDITSSYCKYSTISGLWTDWCENHIASSGDRPKTETLII